MRRQSKGPGKRFEGEYPGQLRDFPGLIMLAQITDQQQQAGQGQPTNGYGGRSLLQPALKPNRSQDCQEYQRQDEKARGDPFSIAPLSKGGLGGILLQVVNLRGQRQRERLLGIF